MANKPLEILKFNGDNNNYPIRTLLVVYGICRTAASTAAKQVDVDINTTTGYLTNFLLEKGATVYVYFELTNSANSPTLLIYNYNASTLTRTAISGQTAAPIYYNGAAISKSYLLTKRVILFIYDGNYFQLVGWVDSNSDTKVTQNPQATDGDYPVIIKAATAVTAVTTTLGFDIDSFTYNPNSNTLKVANTVMTSADVAALVAKSGGVIYFELKVPTASTNGVTVANAPVANTDAVNKQYVDLAFAANDAMIFKGTIGAAALSPTITDLPAVHNAGWTYRVITAGTYAGYNCEVGDLIICIIDGTAANSAHWSAVLYNVEKPAYLDGNTVTNGDLPAFDSTGGKLKDSGYYVNTTLQSIKYVSAWTAGVPLQFGNDITATFVQSFNKGSMPTLTSSNVSASVVKTLGRKPTIKSVLASIINSFERGTLSEQSVVYSAGIITFNYLELVLTVRPSIDSHPVTFYAVEDAGEMPTFEDVLATKIESWTNGTTPTLSSYPVSIPNVVSANVPGTLTTASTDFYALSKR